MHSLPEKFSARIRTQFPEDAEALLSSLDKDPRTSIHLNPWKNKDLFRSESSVPWFDRGKILNERPVFTLDPLFHAGCYYPQESSSMFLHYALEQLFQDNRHLTFLDLCAAPGGKSILISSFLKGRGKLISNEIIRTRNSILRENLIKWGVDNVVVTCNDPEDFSSITNYFDCIVIDAPCSGEGMFRKDVSSRDEWSEDNVRLCASRQKRIIEDISPSLKTGGLLIYSTCTFAPQENELQIQALIDSGEYESVELSVPNEWNIHVLKNGLQFLPHRVQGEGFFISLFRKTSSTSSSFRLREKPSFRTPSNAEKQQVESTINSKGLQLLRTAQGNIYTSAFSVEELNALSNHLYFTMPGTEIGEFMKNEIIPAHAIALSSFEINDVQRIEVDELTALQYLRGESLMIEGNKGKALITFKNIPLGWIKILGNRANNNYPKEWRIRMR
jgi:16S rRNA C967 or C1407 C5-methylase (RsmB/RsmF family)/NOL1/NOP2/fmu family ribosome biogenesis protein